MKQAPCLSPYRLVTRVAALAVCVAFAGALPVAAQSFEIVPSVGYRFGGDFDSFDLDGDELFDFVGLKVDDGASYGVTVDIRIGEAWYLELLANRQDTELTEDGFLFNDGERLFDLEIDYYHAGVMYRWTPGQVQPFVALTGGVTQFAPEPGGLGSETRPSISIGGGVQLMFGDNVGLRFDGRLFATIVDEDEDIFCDRRSCYEFDDSTYFSQGQVSAGLVLAF